MNQGENNQGHALLEHARLLVPSPVVASLPPSATTPPTCEKGKVDEARPNFFSGGQSVAGPLEGPATVLQQPPMHPYMMYMHMMQMQPFAMHPPFPYMAPFPAPAPLDGAGAIQVGGKRKAQFMAPPFYPYSVGIPMMAPPSKRHRNLANQGSSSGSSSSSSGSRPRFTSLLHVLKDTLPDAGESSLSHLAILNLAIGTITSLQKTVANRVLPTSGDSTPTPSDEASIGLPESRADKLQHLAIIRARISQANLKLQAANSR